MSQRKSFLCDLLTVASLWALTAALFWRIALAGRVLAGGDVFTYFYPYWAYATRALQSGRLPLWNPDLFMGAPFLANSQVGLFYPPNWPLWLLLPAYRSVHLTLVLHLCLAALNAYLWGRTSLGLRRLGAWGLGAAFALGGYMGAQVEHVNQLQALAWLPLMLLLYDLMTGRRDEATGSGAMRPIPLVSLALVVGLVLLAGHTQTAFIALLGLAAYGLGPALWRGVRRRTWRPLLLGLAGLTAAVVFGMLLAAVQVAPTLELARLSMRAQGLPFKERVSFSLTPFYVARALLPGYVDPVLPQHIEHVAYVGLTGLALAALGLHTVPQRHIGAARVYRSVYILLGLGLFLSLGAYNPLYWLLARYVPGFAHFRVPARWLALYALGAAALMGRGIDALYHHRRRLPWRGLLALAICLAALAGWGVVGVRLGEGGETGRLTLIGWAAAGTLALALLAAAARAPRWSAVGLIALLLVELFAAATALPHSRATAPQAFTSLRPSIAHLLAAAEREPVPSRFLSMSDLTFDPGDLDEIEAIYEPQLSQRALYEYVVATKYKEVVGPNLSMAFGMPAVDGYGGGVLPLARYVALQRLFLPPDARAVDGRLRETLTTLPDGRWLSLFNVRYVITDKLHDAWVDGVFYDLQFGARLAEGESAAVAHVPALESTALGLVSYLDGAAHLPHGTPVGVVEIDLGPLGQRTFQLRAGEHTAEGLYHAQVAHAQAQVGGHFWIDQPQGNDYVTRLRWDAPAAPVAVRVRATLPAGELIVRGASLIDERTTSFQALTLSDRGHFRQRYSGDVKIYQNLEVLPRAFFVGRALGAADDEAALAVMQQPTFDPAQVVVLSGGPSTGSRDGSAQVRVIAYAPERVVIDVTAEGPGYVVLTDAWYPGWEATVDGQAAAIWRADLFFRAVALEAGRHQVIFAFRPFSLRLGAWISLIGGLGLLAAAYVALHR